MAMVTAGCLYSWVHGSPLHMEAFPFTQSPPYTHQSIYNQITEKRVQSINITIQRGMDKVAKSINKHNPFTLLLGKEQAQLELPNL